MDVLLHGPAEDPALDVALGHALLERVARGERDGLVRLYRPGATVAFGRLDALRPGHGAAAAAARAHGFAPVMRQPGGHAAAYDGDAVCLDIVRPGPDALPALQDRFAEAADLIAGALRGLGVDARVGAVPGEYCPGSSSVNAGGRIKVAGIAQRVVRRAALLGAVVVVGGTARIRPVLEEVYAHLGIAWDAATAGSVQDVAPSVTVAGAEAALLEACATLGPLHAVAADPADLARARELLPRHRV
jgi:octanoyl-[GcvH]:protein N-octanoyltransferase